MEEDLKGFYPITLTPQERKSYNEPLIKVIIELLKARNQQKLNNPIEYNKLLNQVIRQYIIPFDHWLLSVNAHKLWRSITKSRIEKYTYRQMVVCNKVNKKKVKIFKGALKKGEEITIEKGKNIPFNNLFTAEHMITITDIIDTLEKSSSNEVEKILDGMYICRVTKEEDRHIPHKIHRGLDINKILQNEYAKISIVNLKNIKL